VRIDRGEPPCLREAPAMLIGLSSYTYTWAVGVPGYPPPRPLDHMALLQRAAALHADVLQVADNLPLHLLSSRELGQFQDKAGELGVRVEVGTLGTDRELLLCYLSLAQQLGSPILRVVITDGERPANIDEAVAALSPLRHAFLDAGVVLAVENHERFSTVELAELVVRLGTEWAGICLDTVNSFGSLEGPAAVVERLGPLAVNVHLKDFVVERASHHMGFKVEGRPLGQGQLDIPWLVGQLGPKTGNITGVIELWTPPEPEVGLTIAKEEAWARQSSTYLRHFLSARSSSDPSGPRFLGV
jgi:sugar phosphate isomerase/epimerase